MLTQGIDFRAGNLNFEGSWSQAELPGCPFFSEQSGRIHLRNIEHQIRHVSEPDTGASKENLLIEQWRIRLLSSARSDGEICLVRHMLVNDAGRKREGAISNSLARPVFGPGQHVFMEQEGREPKTQTVA